MNICRSVSRTIAILHRRTATEMQKQRNFMLYASTSLRIFISPLSVFLHFLPLPVSLPSLSTLSRIFLHQQTISLWASEEGYTDYQVICIIALMNNVVLIMLLIAPYMTSQRYFTFSEFQPTRMHQLLAFFIIPTLCETDVDYDQLCQKLWQFYALLCFQRAKFFSTFFALAYVIS